MNYGTSGKGTSGLTSFESSARPLARNLVIPKRAPAESYSSSRRVRATSNALGYCPYSPSYDGDMGLGSIWSSNPFGGSSKNVFNQIGKALIAPIRLGTAPILQTLGLKTAAREVNNGLYSKGGLKTVGDVGKAVIIAAATVVTAGAIFGGGAAAGTGVTAGTTAAGAGTGAAAAATGASTGLLGTITGIIGTAAKALSVAQLGAGLFNKGGAQQAGGGGQQVDAQGFYDAGVADGQNGAPRQQVGNAEAQSYYDQGYAAGQAALAASQQQAQGGSAPQIDAQAFYDQGVSDAIAGKIAAHQTVAGGQQYYDQGYNDAKKQIAAAKVFYDQGVADAQAGKPMGSVGNPDGQVLYEKGYTEAMAQKGPLVSDVPGVVQAQAGNSLTGTSSQITQSNQKLANTASLLSGENIGKIAAIAGSLLVIGFIFSNQNPMLAAKRSA